MKTIKLKVSEILADRIQFKPYSARLSNDNLFVQVEVGDANVIRQNGDETVLTVEGLANVMGQIATAIETMHDNYVKNKFKI